MMDRADLGLQHLSLPTAAAVVHIETTGFPPDPSKPAAVRHALDYVAHALSNVVAIYSDDCRLRMPREIPPMDLMEARFSRGARVLTTARGKEYRGLTVQRRDMKAAIAILKRVKFAIPMVCSPGDARAIVRKKLP